MDIGSRCIVMEQALIRARVDHPVRIGHHVLIGPHAHVNGAVVEENAFLATWTSVFPGVRIGAGAEVRINGVVSPWTFPARSSACPARDWESSSCPRPWPDTRRGSGDTWTTGSSTSSPNGPSRLLGSLLL